MMLSRFAFVLSSADLIGSTSREEHVFPPLGHSNSFRHEHMTQVDLVKQNPRLFSASGKEGALFLQALVHCEDMSLRF